MDFENLFTGTKWEIIVEISNRAQSPLELANKLNTTIANISQQLRLLEAAGLVKTQKTRDAEKGKPRIIYSLSKDFVYFVSLNNSGAQKRIVEANTHHGIISRIWQIKNIDLHYDVEKIYFELDSIFNEISQIAIDEISSTIYVVSKKEKKIEHSRLKVKFVSEIKNNDALFIYRKEQKLQ